MRAIQVQLDEGDAGTLPFSTAIETGGFIFLSGRLALRDGRIVADDIAAQFDAIIEDVAAILKTECLGLDHVAKVTMWIVDAAHFAALNAAYARCFTAPYPARSTVVSGLVIPGALIEVEIVASRSVRQS